MVNFREVFVDEFELVIQLRLDFIKTLKPEADIISKELVESTRSYFHKQMESGGYIGFVGQDNGTVVCAAGMLLYSLPPLTNNFNRSVGHVLNFFTYPEFRKRGYGRGLMEYIKERANARNVFRLFLNATTMGEPLYRQCGFSEPETAAMELNLR